MTGPKFLPFNFLGLDKDESSFEKSRVVILPVPYERTVSFGRGTAKGPSSIIYASRSLELYDDELQIEPCEVGIHTLPELECEVDPSSMIETLHDVCLDLLQAGKFVITLGGEHLITAGVVKAHKSHYGDFSVLNIDAHCDLRNTYEGTPYNHACVMRRVFEMGCPLVEVGIRSYSKEEAEFIQTKEKLKIIHSKQIEESADDSWIEEALSQLFPKVYISVDVDAFDPSIVPGTGTPEPGGLSWHQVMGVIRKVFNEKEVIGFDIVELSPVAGITGPDVLAAKLAYKTVGYKFKKQGHAAPCP